LRVRATHKAKIVLCLFLMLISIVVSPSRTSANDSEQGEPETNIVTNQIAKPKIYHPSRIDKDFDGIVDSLETTISQTSPDTLVPVVVTLFNPVTDLDLNLFAAFGGNLTYVYRYVTYGLAGSISAGNLSRFAHAEGSNLVVIERDVPVEWHLDLSVPLTRVRPVVWNDYGYRGSENRSVAIIDTGIDDSHPDLGPYGNLNFSRKIVGWYDATSDGATTPEDFGEHGTHVSGIATGTGAANSLQGIDSLTTTFTYVFPNPGWGYGDYFDVKVGGVITLTLTWEGKNEALMRLYSPGGSFINEVSGKTKPLVLTYDTRSTSYPTGRYSVIVYNLAGASGNAFSCTENFPYQGLNDGDNLFTGVAPNSRLVGVKVFDNRGSGSSASVIAGLDWVVENHLAYHIVVASMSLGLENGAVDTTLDQKVDTLVSNGIVTVVSAGNDYPSYTIGSPGTAAYAITVAATNDQNGITDYSSNGDTAKNEYGLIKPDVAAPGGTFQPVFGNQILSVDSNDVDGAYSGYADRVADDYQQMGGTSMSAPHVSGLAALLAQALGDWSWSLEEALKVKMLISMTAFETQNGEGSNLPLLNRGGKDSVEGYGRISGDAAIEAVTMTYNVGSSATDVFGANPSDKRVWARQVSLQSGYSYDFELSVPSGSDYDLHLYDGSPDAYGQPIILKKSVNASLGGLEAFNYVPSASGSYYIVAKWVSGSGQFTLNSVGTSSHDVAVVGLDPSPIEVYVGGGINITVTVRNEGLYAESFNVTISYDSTPVSKQQVIGLGNGVSRNLTFLWNTAGVTPNLHYVITASADIVAGELETLDNTRSYENIAVKILGDINSDGNVNASDLSSLSGGYGFDSDNPGWNPNFDLSNDGIIDAFDLFDLGKNYGKTSP